VPAVEDTSVGITLTATDPGADVLTYSVVLQPASGLLSGTAPNLIYTPDPDFAGQDSFTFVANDGQIDSLAGTVTVTVSPVNDAPMVNAVAASTNEDTEVTWGFSATDIDSASLTYSIVLAPAKGTVVLGPGQGEFTYLPSQDINGLDTFSYQAFDGELYSGTALVTITINAVNDNPVANDDGYVRIEGASLVVAAPGVLENDSDVDGDALAATQETMALNGSVVLDSDGGFTYTPSSGFFGTDSFTYLANDGNGGSDTATVTVGVPYGFIGLLSPWKEKPLYTFKVGSTFPISWQYTDPATGQVVDSENAMIEVQIKGPFTCSAGETDATVEFIKFPGNSDYRYSTGTHKLNWDTNDLGLGCYNIRIYSGLTTQTDGPFKVKIRK
ncbi:MAG: tandem-95 repeat protein, partial [Nitrospirae bacterium]|nr:tandem-95 repeat protein [Nitrospirota bacterium]